MSFLITIPDSEPKTYTKRNAAIAFVDKQAHEHGLVLKVVDVESGNIVHVGDPVAGARYFRPFERVETPRKVVAPDFEGFVPAYHRVRIDATVFRGLDEFGLKGTWRVYDGRSKRFVDVESTKAANEVTKGMKTAQL